MTDARACRRVLAAEELLRRRRARTSLRGFCRGVRPGYIHGPHHTELCTALEQLEARKLRRLVVQQPPRVGKSYHVSESFPAWYLGRNPTHHIITAAHGERQARRFGRRVRDLIGSEAYRCVFPNVTLSKRADASDEFETNAGGRYIAVGIHGGFMGSGAHCLVLDDPFRSRADADSQAVRDKVWGAFDDLETRLEPGGVVVVMHTRWHEDDTVGRIIRERVETGAEEWTVLTQPMIVHECANWEQVEAGGGTDADRNAYEQEEALWAERYDLAAVRHIRRTRPRRTWVALYQQSPAADEGDYFRRAWFQRYRVGEQPEKLRKFLVADFGVRAGDGDHTEIYCIGLDPERHMWLLEAWVGQEAADVWCDALVSMMLEHRPDAFFGEAGVIRRAVEPFLRMMMDDRNANTMCEWIAPVGDKQARARPLQGLASLGRLHVPDCDWGDRWVDHACAFPTSLLDHGVDAVGLMGLALEEAHPAVVSRAVDEQREDRWTRVLRQQREGGKKDWKVA